MNTKYLRILPILLMTLINYSLLQSQNLKYDWTYIHTDGTGKKAFLWIPSSCTSGIKALFISSHTSIDPLLVTDSAFREMAEKEQMAIIYSRQSISCWAAAIDTSKILTLLDNFALFSGFTEIKYAPWITWGHSAGTDFAVSLAYWKPSRTIAVITHSGNLKYPTWTSKELPNIPFMAIKGQFEEWSVGTNTPSQCGTEYEYNWVKDTVIKTRRKNVSPFLGCVTMRPGEGHMGINTKLEVPLIAIFIQKAINKRVPKEVYATNTPITLNSINENSGWLSDTSIISNYNGLKIDSFPNFADSKKCFWHIDKEMAYAWYHYQKDILKQKQDLNLRANPPIVTPTMSFNFGNSGTNDCGLNFQSASNWDISKDYKITGLKATSNLPVKLVAQDGPGYIINDSVLRINPCIFDLNTRTRLLMIQEGNNSYQIRDRQLSINYSKKTTGIAQTANIAAINPCTPGDTITYNATLTSGLSPVVYLFSGPGKIINGNKIVVLPFVSKTGTTTIVLRAAHNGNTTYASSNIAEISINVNSILPNAPGNIIGLNTISPLAENVQYSISVISNATTYNWTVPTNTQIVSGQGTNTIYVNFLSGFSEGAIRVKGINANGSGSISTKEVLSSIVRINSTLAKNHKITIYPNPNNGSFTISGVTGLLNISIYKVTGELIFNKNTDSDIPLNLGKEKGVFIIIVKSEANFEQYKLIIQ